MLLRPCCQDFFRLFIHCIWQQNIITLISESWQRSNFPPVTFDVYLTSDFSFTTFSCSEMILKLNNTWNFKLYFDVLRLPLLCIVIATVTVCIGGRELCCVTLLYICKTCLIYKKQWKPAMSTNLPDGPRTLNWPWHWRQHDTHPLWQETLAYLNSFFVFFFKFWNIQSQHAHL